MLCAAATEFAAIQSTLAPRMSALTKVLRNAPKLPAGYVLTLCGCATSTPQPTPPTKAALDSALAAPCPVVPRPATDDYDSWQAWSIDLLRLYAECAACFAKDG